MSTAAAVGSILLTGTGWSTKAEKVITRVFAQMREHSEKYEVHIGTLNNNGVINDFSLHQEVSMPFPESWQKEYEKEHGKKAAHKPVKLNAGVGRKLDFLRVLVALHEAGYFTDEAGGQIDRKDIFAAFGGILGIDLDRANANLSEGLNHYNQEDEGRDIRCPEEGVCGV